MIAPQMKRAKKEKKFASELKKGEVIIEIAWTNYAETKSYQEYLKLTYGEQIVEETENLDEEEPESDGE